MAKGIGTIAVKRQRGKLTVMGLGKTPRGQNFIKDSVEIHSPSTRSPDFKEKLSAAVEKLFA